MSAQALSGSGTGMPAGELATVQRVQQLQALIESARQVASGGALASPDAGQGSGGDFASALQAATGTPTAAEADPSAVAGSTGYTGVVGAAAGLGSPGISGAAGIPGSAGTAGSPSIPDPAGVVGSPGVLGSTDVAYQSPLQSAVGGESGEYEALIAQAADRNGLDPAVLHGLIQQESGFDPSATSGAGAEGLTQLMPGTASSLGVANPLDPAESIEGGARYLGQLMRQFAGNTADALAAYNAGPGAVQQYGGIPPYAETQSYVTKVLGNAEAYRQAHPATITGGLA